MPLTAADIKFFAAANQTDAADGGGRRSSTLVQDGLDNNLFPDVTAGDRTSGQTRLRKVYPSLTNTDTAALLGGALAMDSEPADSNTTLVMFATGGAVTARATATAALRDSQQSSLPTGLAYGATATASGGSADLTSPAFSDSSSFDIVAIGKFVLVLRGGTALDGGARYPAQGAKLCVRKVLSRGVNIVLDAPLPASMAGFVEVWPISTYDGGMRVYGTATTTAAALSGAVDLVTASPFTQIAGPADGGVYLSESPGFGAFFRLASSAGRVRIVRAGDEVTLWHEQATSPATATAGTVSVGRTDLDQLAVVGNNGVEIARFLKDGPTPTPTSGAMTVDLAAGTVTFSSVAGFSQPVTIRHRISHRGSVSAVNGATVTISPALTRDFPSGSKISSHLPLGDVQARAYNVFAQQAWTRVFSDTLIGSSVTLPYSGTPGITNQGAETDRYAIVFTASNAFDCYSEARGFIASGSTASNFSPVNPATGAPFFTLLAASWAATILVGSVLRFNTDAAAPPVWVLRCTVPGAGSGNSTAALRLLGAT